MQTLLKEKILELDNYICQAWGCNKRENLEIHHIIPRSLGGKNVEWNLISLCHKHHEMITMGKILPLTATQPISQPIRLLRGLTG